MTFTVYSTPLSNVHILVFYFILWVNYEVRKGKNLNSLSSKLRNKEIWGVEEDQSWSPGMTVARQNVSNQLNFHPNGSNRFNPGWWEWYPFCCPFCILTSVPIFKSIELLDLFLVTIVVYVLLLFPGIDHNNPGIRKNVLFSWF
jgi:hypothetical protein